MQRPFRQVEPDPQGRLQPPQWLASEVVSTQMPSPQIVWLHSWHSLKPGLKNPQNPEQHWTFAAQPKVSGAQVEHWPA